MWLIVSKTIVACGNVFIFQIPIFAAQVKQPEPLDLPCRPDIPVAGLALILGIDRFMSEARALTNLIGNGVATVVAAKWESELDEQKLHAMLNPMNINDEV